MKQTMRLRIPLLAFSALMLLAGCNASPPRSKLPDVKNEAASHDIVYASGTYLSSAEAASLDAFIQSVPAQAAHYVSLAAYDYSDAEKARIGRLRKYLVKKGVAADVIHVQPASGNANSVVTLTVQYAVAVPPGHCPDWSANPVVNYANTDFSNFGCSYYNNIVVQVQDPEDYRHGHGTAAYDGARESNVIQPYLAGTNTGAAAASASSSASPGG